MRGLGFDPLKDLPFFSLDLGFLHKFFFTHVRTGQIATTNVFQCFILKNLYCAFMFGFHRSGHKFRMQLAEAICSVFHENCII